MSRSAKLGLFLLMGLVVALARLVEIEVARFRPSPAEVPLEIGATLTRRQLPEKRSSPAKHAPAKPAPSKAEGAAPAPARAAPAPEAPSPVAPAAAEAEWPRGPYYTVKKGETLGEIAQKVLGSSRHWQKLHDANQARVPNLKALKPGMRLLVPAPPP